jgi:uncharacterized membrane protein
MPEETPEPSSEARLGAWQASFLAGIVTIVSLLVLILLVGMIGLLAYGLFTGSALAFMGGSLCLAACLILVGLLTLIFKIAGVQKDRAMSSVAMGRETYAKVKEELRNRYNRAQAPEREPQSLSDNLTTGRKTYIKVKEELSRRYERAKDGEY